MPIIRGCDVHRANSTLVIRNNILNIFVFELEQFRRNLTRHWDRTCVLWHARGMYSNLTYVYSLKFMPQ